MDSSKALALLLMVALLSPATPTDAGPTATGICYAGCAGVVVACFTAAGAVFGTVPGSVIAASPTLALCNTAFGVCEAACMAAFFLPTP